MKSVFISCLKQKYILLALSVLFVFLSCISLSAAEPKVVRIGAFNFYPGIFKDTDGVVKGFYVDALADIAQRENIKFEYVYGSWSEGLERIKSGEVDVLTSVAFTEERAAFLDYTVTPLLTVWGELYTPLESEIHGILDVRGKKIAVMEGDYNASNFIDLVKKFDIPCEFVSMPGFDDVFRAVAARKVDAGVVNNTFGAAKQKEYGLRSTGVVFNPFDIFFAVAKGKNQPLLALLESNLASWRHQAGSPFNEARKKWSHSGGIVNIIPRWLVTALVLVALLMALAVGFVVVLKKQVRSKTKSIVESVDRYKSLSLRQEAILASVPDIIMETDVNKVYTWANPAGLEFFGDDVVGREACYYFESEQNTYEVVQPLFNKSKDVIYVESLQRRKDGAHRLLSWWSKSLVDEQGNVTGALSTARDITESTLAEQKLRLSEERFRLAIEATNDGLWEWDMLTNKEFFSPRWCEIIGYTFDDPEFPHCFSSWAERIHPDDYAHVMNAKKEHFEKGAAYNVVYRHKHKSGEYRWQNSRGKAIFDESGKPVKMVGCISDITERKQTADALHKTQVSLYESEHHFRTLANGGNALIWTSGADKLCNYFNEPWLRYTGRTLEQEFGNGWTEGVHPDDFDRCLDIYVSHFDRCEPFSMEYRLLKANGKYGWILDLGNPRHDSEGNFTGYIGYCYDITDRKQTEEKMAKQLHELQRWHNVMLDREDRVIELKREVNELLAKAGESPRYASAVAGNLDGMPGGSPPLKETKE